MQDKNQLLKMCVSFISSNVLSVELIIVYRAFHCSFMFQSFTSTRKLFFLGLSLTSSSTKGSHLSQEVLPNECTFHCLLFTISLFILPFFYFHANFIFISFLFFPGIRHRPNGIPEEEENFDEAIKSVNKALVPTGVSARHINQVF